MGTGEETTSAPEALAAFVGHWRTDGEVLATLGTPAVPIAGTDRHEWLPGEYALLHTLDIAMGDDRARLLEVIGWTAARGVFAIHSFRPDGGADTMYASESAGVWTFEGVGARFSGGFGADGGIAVRHLGADGRGGGVGAVDAHPADPRGAGGVTAFVRDEGR